MKNKKKNRYKKLKSKIVLQTLVAGLASLIASFLVLHLLIDGFFQSSFYTGYISIMIKMGVRFETADRIYGIIFMNNKNEFIIVGSILLLLIFLFFSIGRITKYLDSIGDGIEDILSDSKEPIDLPEGLEPISQKLNTIKTSLVRRQSEAQINEKKKNDLVAYLAHDLKTPLTSIIAYLSVLDGHADMPEEERIKYIHISLEKALRMGDLVNEFFEIITLNLQDIVLEMGRINISLMLEQVADEFFAVLDEKNLTCSVETDEDLIVEADADKLARVFDNLLRNAISYSYPDTDIHISAKSKKSVVEITFTNHGDCIPASKLHAIFEKFYRVDNARSSKTGGVGLGLAIAKDITEMHGGTIEADSDEFSTRFIVRLPKARKNGAKGAARSKKNTKLLDTSKLPLIKRGYED